MAMQFEQFVRDLDVAIRALGSVGAFDTARPTSVAWSAGERRAAVTLVPPLNVSVALEHGSRPADETWYPIDAALVPVVSRRIAGYLSES